MQKERESNKDLLNYDIKNSWRYLESFEASRQRKMNSPRFLRRFSSHVLSFVKDNRAEPKLKETFAAFERLVFDHFINSLKRKRTIIQLTQRGRERQKKNEKKREKKILKGFPGSSRFSSMNRLPFRRLDIPLGLIRSISGDFSPCLL